MAGEKSIMYDPILGQFRRRDKGGGSDFDPNGIYPGLTAGNLLGKDGDAVLDQTTGKLFRSSGGDESISDGEAKISFLRGALEHVNGVSMPFTASHFRSIGYNAFNPDNVLNNVKIEGGQLVEAEGWRTAYVHVLQGVLNSNNGYVVAFGTQYKPDAITVGLVSRSPEVGDACFILTAQTITGVPCYLPLADGWMLISTQLDLSKLCVHLKWSYGHTQEKYEEYWESIIPLPQTHEWGTGRINNIYDEIDFSALTMTIAIDRVKLSELHWIKETVEHDPDDEHAETWYTYNYTSGDLSTSIKASTTNIDYFGVTDCSILVTDEGVLLIEAGETELDLPAIFGDVYLYYEKSVPVYRYIELSDYYGEEVTEIVVYYNVSDFGTEEYLNSVVAPSQTAYLYLPNMVDSLRALMYQDKTDRTATIDFGEVRDMVSKRNLLGEITLNSIKCDNVDWLKIYLNGTLSLYVQNIENGQEVLANSLAVADGAKMTFEIGRINYNSEAQVNYTYTY